MLCKDLRINGNPYFVPAEERNEGSRRNMKRIVERFLEALGCEIVRDRGLGEDYHISNQNKE